MGDGGTIRIRNAVFYAYHGVSEGEQNLGGKFEIDVDLSFDMAAAGETDSLQRTIDYESVYERVQRVVTTNKYYLLEAIAENVSRVLMRDFHLIDDLTVRIRKPHPPVKGVVDYIEVEVRKSR